MTAVRKRIRNGRVTYELWYSYYDNGKTRIRSKYLGTSIPGNVEEIEGRFTERIDNELIARKEGNIRGMGEKVPDAILGRQGFTGLPSFGVCFTFGSLRLSGSRLTLLDTFRTVETGKTIRGRSWNDISEAKAHFNLLQDLMRLPVDLSPETITDWHWKLFRISRPSNAGLFRTENSVEQDSGCLYPDPSEIRGKLESLFSWYSRHQDTYNPVIVAARVHHGIWAASPFTYGNGMISRLALNYVLHSMGYPMFSFMEIHAERGLYRKAIERSLMNQNGREFVKWFARQYGRVYFKRQTGDEKST